MKKIITYGVRNYELPTFEKLKEKYDYKDIPNDTVNSATEFGEYPGTKATGISNFLQAAISI